MQQYRVLVLLGTRGPMRSSDLALELGLLASGITRIVNRLIGAGYVLKQAGQKSRREVIVTATDSGLALVRDALDRRREELSTLLTVLSAPDRKALVRASRALASALDGDEDLGHRILTNRHS
ncbi:MarR family winged helix-turn-helix transcriptional regulator [Frondihabitans peucedani]